MLCLFLQFPLYWFSVPAIMKGWIDRVLTQGFAFSLQNMYNNGVFKVSLRYINEQMYCQDILTNKIRLQTKALL